MTGGSRTTFATGMAVVQACEDIIAQCKQRAALTWDLDEEQVDWVDGEAVPKPGVNADVKPLSLADIARGAGRTGGPLLGRASLNAQGAGASFSCNFTDTIVDTETGKVDVLSFTAVQDAGWAILPSYVEGQMQGGAVQGIGWALNEEYIYDDNGVMENAGFLDYRVPVASDMPMIDTEIIEVPNPFHPYGVRGVGETPIVAPLAAVSNAVRVAVITMNRPETLNALTDRTQAEIRHALDQSERNEDVIGTVLTGAGRGFCSGVDMNALGAMSEAGRRLGAVHGDLAAHPGNPDGDPNFEIGAAYFLGLRKPLIAAINGACAGLGFSYAVFCDLRFADRTARFVTSFSQRGLIAEHGVSWMLPRLIGPANALDIPLDRPQVRRRGGRPNRSG